MNQTLKSLGLLLLSGCVLCAQDYLFQYQASVSVAANGDFQNPRVAPVDDRVYLVDGWMGLIVWDVADPSRPTPIGEYRPGETFNLVDVAAAGSTVYVIDDYDYSRLRILDFTDPLSPVELGVLGGADADPQLSYPSYVEQEGGLCFLWQPMWELQIVDVSDPTDPVVRATRNISECIDLAVQGNLVFLAMQSQGLTIWDVSDPSAVTEVGSYQLGEFQYANAIHVEGSTAYLATSEGLKVLDVANPSDPVLVESLHAVYAGADMAIANGFIFLNQFDGVRVFDATDLANVLDYGVTPFPTLGSAYQMVQQGDRLTLAATPDGLILADIASPPGIEFSGTTKGMAGGQEYETSEGLAVAVAGFGGITVIDESNPDNPFSINPLTLPGHCTGLARLGNVAYVAAGYAGLHVVDLSDPMSPLLSGTITTPGRPSDVAVFNDRLWVADGSEGMSVFEVSVAESPSLVTSLALPAGARHLTLAPPYAYVTGSYSQVSVLDLTDPANPSIVATFDTAGPSMRPEILGELLLLPEGQAGVEVFDVAIASAPERVVHLEFGAEVLGVAIIEGYLLAALPEARMVLVDISEPGLATPVVDQDTSILSGQLYPTGSGWVSLVDSFLTYFFVERNAVFQRVSSWPGHQAGIPYKLKISGNRLYVTAGESLLAYDLSAPAEPRLLSSFVPSDYYWLGDLDVVGDTVYLGLGQGLSSFDLTNPAFPVPVGRVGLPDEVNSVGVDSDWVLAGNAFGAGLFVVDITEPSAPVHLGTYQSPSTSLEAAARKGGVIFSEAFGGRIDIVDASDPTTPTLVASLNTDAWDFSDFDVVGDWFIAAGDGYGLADISNPAAPGFPISGWEEDQFTTDMHAFSDYLYFADANLGLMIVDLADPLNPVTASITAAGLVYPTGIQVSGDHAYVADERGLHVIDVTDRAQPVPLQWIPTAVRMVALDVSGDLAVGSSGDDNGLFFLDVSDPAVPRLLSSHWLDAPVHHLQVVDNWVVLANGFRGLAIWDVSDPTQPVEVGLSGVVVALDLIVVGHHAYVAGGDGGLTIFDVTNPNTPTPVANQPTAYPAERVFVQGNRAYVLMGSNGVEVYDVSTPDTPAFVGAFTGVSDEVGAVAVRGDQLFVGVGYQVQIIDFSDPANPVNIGPTVYLNDQVQELYLEGDTLLVALGSPFSFAERSSVAHIDYSRRNQWDEPLVTSYELTGNTRAFVVQDDLLFVAREDWGLATLRLASPEITRPSLIVSRVPGGVEVTWPAGFDGFVLESSQTLPAVRWDPVPGGDTSGVNVPTEGGTSLFLRLRGP